MEKRKTDVSGSWTLSTPELSPIKVQDATEQSRLGGWVV